MTLLHQFIYVILWVEIIGAALFLAACAVGVGLFGYAKWSERRRHAL